jgi:hypothetical protein
MRNVFKNEQGLACIEFAICVPVLLLMFMGGVELTRFMITIEKVEQTVGTAADITAQTQTSPALTNTQFLAQESNILSAVPDIMAPYATGSNTYVIITDITQNANGAVINWQYCGGGSLAGQKSKLGNVIAGPATLPAGFAIPAGEEIVIAEIYYNFTPMLVQGFLPAQTLYRTSTFMPRQGALTTFQSNCN